MRSRPDEGYDVIAVANADEAIKVLETRNDIRTIFTDIDLPGSMDGLETGCSRERSLAAGPHHRHDWHESASPRRDACEQHVYCQAVS
jgi:hypothetical protein